MPFRVPCASTPRAGRVDAYGVERALDEEQHHCEEDGGQGVRHARADVGAIAQGEALDPTVDDAAPVRVAGQVEAPLEFRRGCA